MSTERDDGVGDDWEVRGIRPSDAGEVLTLQRAAFTQEAQIYGDAGIAALVQTLAQIEAELTDNLGCVVVDGGRVVGAVRAIADGEMLLIGRLCTAPDAQGEGIGSALLAAVEERGRAAGCREAELFTGSRSEANLRLYERDGYTESERVDQGDGTAQIFLRKSL